jgi:Tol biopolymer transport system component
MLAFTSLRDGRPRIWLKQLSSGGEAVLTDGPDWSPRFAPDGDSLVFIRLDGETSSVHRTALVGGQPRKLIHDAESADLSPDGRRLAFIREGGRRGQIRSSIWMADVDGSNEQELHAEDGHTYSGIRWSPDGTTLVVARGMPINAAAYQILLVDVETGTATQLDGLPPDVRPTEASWSATGRELIYAWLPALFTELPIARFLAHAVDTVAVRPLFWAQDVDNNVCVAGPGTLVYGTVSRRQDLRIVMADGSQDPLPLTMGSAVDRQPVFSPDGDTVLFSSGRAGNLDLWTVSVSTGGVHRLTEDAAADWDPAYTPDGRSILWSSARSGNLEVWTARADGSGARQVTHDGVDAENPTMTADGAWIVYSTTNPDHVGLRRVRPDGSDDSEIVAGACFLPEVSPDGRTALYLNTDAVTGDNVLRFVDVETATQVPFEIPLPFPEDNPLAGNYGRARWLHDGRGVVFVALDERGQFGVLAQDFRPGEDTTASRRLFATLGPGTVIESFGLTRDGTRVVCSSQQAVASIAKAVHVPGVDLPSR